jgi:hypothetical protein
LAETKSSTENKKGRTTGWGDNMTNVSNVRGDAQELLAPPPGPADGSRAGLFASADKHVGAPGRAPGSESPHATQKQGPLRTASLGGTGTTGWGPGGCDPGISARFPDRLGDSCAGDRQTDRTQSRDSKSVRILHDSRVEVQGFPWGVTQTQALLPALVPRGTSATCSLRGGRSGGSCTQAPWNSGVSEGSLPGRWVVGLRSPFLHPLLSVPPPPAPPPGGGPRGAGSRRHSRAAGEIPLL